LVRPGGPSKQCRQDLTVPPVQPIHDGVNLSNSVEPEPPRSWDGVPIPPLKGPEPGATYRPGVTHSSPQGQESMGRMNRALQFSETTFQIAPAMFVTAPPDRPPPGGALEGPVSLYSWYQDGGAPQTSPLLISRNQAVFPHSVLFASRKQKALSHSLEQKKAK
jgi:hypothetical protein